MIYLYSLGAANGLVLSVLLCFHSRATSASKVLGLWCLLLSLNFLGYFLYVDNQINSISFLIGWSYFLPAAYGGLLYLYCLKLCNQQPIKWVDSVHLIPLILCYLLNFDILMAPAEQKLAYISTLPPQTPSFFVSQFVLYAQAFFYGVLSIGVLFKYKRQVKEQYSNIKGSLTLWLKVLIGITLTIWLVKLIPSLMGTGFWLSEVGSVLIVVLIYSIGYVHWSNPHLFKVDEVIEFHELSNEFNADAGQNQKLLRDTNKVGSRLALDQGSHQQIADIVIVAMQKEQLFRREDLSLQQLAAHCQVSIHHLSETLNHFINKNFYRFVNEFRVEYFCQQLTLSPSENIIDIAMRSGFANKSTFNSAFKEIKQQTPSLYRSRLKT